MTRKVQTSVTKAEQRAWQRVIFREALSATGECRLRVFQLRDEVPGLSPFITRAGEGTGRLSRRLLLRKRPGPWLEGERIVSNLYVPEASACNRRPEPVTISDTRTVNAPFRETYVTVSIRERRRG
jgi:hypothetical protein